MNSKKTEAEIQPFSTEASHGYPKAGPMKPKKQTAEAWKRSNSKKKKTK